jgi:methionyl-tRNA synthetase
MPVQQRDCNDHWCEHYGKGGGECDRCGKEQHSRDAPELREILRRRAEEHAEFSDGEENGRGQER